MDILKKTKCKSFFLKCISLLICAIMVFSVFTVSTIAQSGSSDVWDGTKAESFAGGKGTAAEPFEIETPEQLYKMLMEYSTVTASKGVYFEIKNDIYLNDVADGTFVKNLANKQNWLKEYGTLALPNGSTSNAFCGTLYGNGYTIYGLYTSGAGRSGLFHTLVNGASIIDLAIDNAYLVDGGGYGGALVGRTMYVSGNAAIVIENCSVTNAEIGGNMELAGGLIGHTSDGSINFANCYSYNLTLSNWEKSGTPGGITGGAWDGGTVKMINCYTVGHFISNSKVNKTECTNVYTNVAVPSGNTTAGVTILTDDQMKGEAAKTNMAGFNFETVWETVENEYPIINLRSNGKEVWDGTKARKFARGKGTAAEPFEIETPQQLYKMLMEYSTVKASKGVYFEIKNDIYLNDVADGTFVKDLADKQNWLKEYGTSALPNGSSTNAFAGTLDGNGHTIYGLYTSGAGRSGLFHTIVNGATIKNLSMDNVYLVDGKGYGGALVGRAIYLKDNPASEIKNCSVTNAEIGGDMELAGGLIGYTSDGSINFANCYSYNLTLSNWEKSGTPGGITGGAWDGGTVKMINCYTVGYFVSNSKVNKTKCTNVYTNVAVPSDNTTAGVTVLTDDQMKGEAAKYNMGGFDFGAIWETVENGYPIINVKEGISPLWNGTIAKGYESGSGTKNDPYIIATAEQLAYVVTKDYTKLPGLYFKLANDIRLNDTSRDNWKDTAINWVWANVRFVGNFDGNGHTIDGLYFNGSQKRMGLFSYIGDSVIKNLVITNASITNTSSEEGTAILAGQASAKATFEAIYIDANSELSAPNCKGVGGIIARSNQNIIIKNSAVLATIKGKTHVGAFFGTHWGGLQTINNSFSTSNVPIMTSRKLMDSKNNYVIVKEEVEEETNRHDGNPTVLTADQMKGEAAKTNMPKLNYKYVWKTVDEGYPEFDLRERPTRPDHVWDGTKAKSFAGGTGLPDDPYLVSNGAQLYKMVTDFKAKYNDGTINTTTYFKITNDIYLNDVKQQDLINPTVEKWDDAGYISWCTDDYASREEGFCGEVDGNGYTIYGLYCEGGSFAGLIPVACDTTNVYNLNLKNSFIRAGVNQTGAATGGIIGLISGAAINRSTADVTYCKVDNCYFSADNEEIYRVGAVIGGGYNEGKVVISDCGVTNIQMNIINPKTVNRTSAFLGYTLYSIHEITNCYSDSSVHPVTDSTDKTLNEDGKTNYDLIHSSRTYTNVYTSSKKADVDIYGDIIYIDESKMKGEAAKKNLKGFDFEKDWVVVENNYPTYRDDPGIWKYDDSLPGEVWSGKIARIYATGNGSKEKPFIIETAGQLALLANDSLNGKTNGRYYKITQDIILNDTSKENWKETANEWFVGSWEQAFKGHLDGDYHTISGLYLNKTKETYNGPKYYGGLFAAISTHAVIEKLGIVNSSMVFTPHAGIEKTYIGAFAGFISYEDFSYDDENKVKHYVTSEEYPIIRECFADTSVYLEAGTCGGFIGSAQAPIRIEDSFFTGTVKGTGRGLFGYSEMTLYDDVLVKNFYAADSDYAIISNVSYDKFKYENTYSSAAQDTDGVTRLFIDRMIGTAAKTYMTGLDFDNVWVIRGDNETPGLKGFKMDSYSNVMNPKDIKITFETYCDLEVADMQGKAYSKLKLPVLERDGYKFEGWYAYPELDVPYNYDYFPTFDTILYAKWTLKGFEQGFELYEDSIYDYHEDYEYYLPTMSNYSTDYVHSGGKSMHRIGSSNEELDFLLMYKEELEIGKKYKIVFYTTTDQANASVDISLVHLDWPDVYSANVGVEKIASVTNLVDGKWVEVSYTFVARSKWIAIRTSGNTSVYFDDFVLFEGGKGEIINLNNPQQTVKPNVDSEKQENGNTEEIVEDEDSFIESKPDNMQVNTKPKSEKNSMLVWYIVIAVAAVLILGGAAFVIIKRVKRK